MFSSSSHQASLKKTDGDTSASIEANSSNKSHLHLHHFQQSSGVAVRSNTAATATTRNNNNNNGNSIASARETDPLLQARRGGSNPPDLFGFQGISSSAPSSSIRVRRSSKSPVQTAAASMLPSSHLINHNNNISSNNNNNNIVNNSIGINNHHQQRTHNDLPMTLTHGYEAIEEAVVSPRTRQEQHLQLAAARGGGGGGDDGNGSNMFNSNSASQQQQPNHPQHSLMYHSHLPSNPSPSHHHPTPGREPLSPGGSQRSSSGATGSTTSYSGHRQQQAPILEIPEEIYIVRKAALQVLKPLTKTWVRHVHSITPDHCRCMGDALVLVSSATNGVSQKYQRLLLNLL
jgi:hypothetical protein